MPVAVLDILCATGIYFGQEVGAMFSDTLRNLGFVPVAEEDGFTRSPYECERGTFYRVHLDGERRTFAIDEHGDRWTTWRYVNLRHWGFSAGDDYHWWRVFDGFQKLCSSLFWRTMRTHFRDVWIFAGCVLCFFGRDILRNILVPKKVHKAQDDELF